MRLLLRRIRCGGVLRLLVLLRRMLPLPPLPLPPVLLRRRLHLLLLQCQRQRVVVCEPRGRGATCAGDLRLRGPWQREKALG